MALALHKTLTLHDLLLVVLNIRFSECDTLFDVTHRNLLSNPSIIAGEIIHNRLLIANCSFIYFRFSISSYNVHANVDAVIILYLIALWHLSSGSLSQIS